MSKHLSGRKIDDGYNHRDRFPRARGVSLEQLDAYAEKQWSAKVLGGYSKLKHKICPSCYIAMKQNSDQCDYCN